MDFAAPFLLTVKLSTITTLLLFVLGIPFAYWLAFSRFRGKLLIESVVALPLVLPPTVLGFYLLMAVGGNSFVGRWYEDIFSKTLAFSFQGLVVGSLIYNLPFAIRPFQSAFAGVDKRLLEASWSLGRSKLYTFLVVNLSSLQARCYNNDDSLQAVEEDDAPVPSGRRISPGIVVRGPVHESNLQRTESAIAVLDEPGSEPVTFRRVAERQTLRYIRIVDLKNHHRVVTVVEFISPANKTPAGKEHYRRKQNELIDGGVSLVEIDLLRCGEWVIASDYTNYPVQLRAPYRICVTRSTALLDGEAYPASFSAPLPNIRIPLRAADADIRWPLQKLLNQAYENGRYGLILDYDRPPELPCSDEEWAWIQERLDLRNGLANRKRTNDT